MVSVSIEDNSLVCEVEGMHKIWACKSSLTVPLEHVLNAEIRTEATQSWWHGWKMVGTDIPGVFAAGLFKANGKWVFWDVRHPENAIEIDLHDETYSSLLIEVEDPEATVALIRSAIEI